jgi:hypothetical protein
MDGAPAARGSLVAVFAEPERGNVVRTARKEQAYVGQAAQTSQARDRQERQ